MNVSIRYATKSDAELIADISRQTFYETFAAQNTKENMDMFLNLQFTKGRLMMEVGSPDNIFLMAYFGDQLAGYAKLRSSKHPEKLNSGNTLEIARLYAIQALIGKGVGKELMKKSIDIAIEQKVDYLWLGVWKENHRALQFYQRWGFEIFDEVDFILGSDLQKDWLMKKKITSDEQCASHA